MGAQSQRRVLSRLIENMSDEELSQVTKMAKDEMNRRGELSEGFIMINEPGQHSEGSQRKPQPTTLVRTLRCDQIETSLPLRTSGEASPEHGQEPRGGALLHLPASPGSTVRIQTMDTLSAIEGCDQLEVSPTTRRQSQILCRGAGRNGPGNLPSLRNSPEGIERIPDQGDMPLLQQGDSPGEEECGHRNGLSQQSVGGTATPADSDITSGRNDRAGRLPGLHGLPALAPNEGPIKPMTPKLERKLRAALKKAEGCGFLEADPVPCRHA